MPLVTVFVVVRFAARFACLALFVWVAIRAVAERVVVRVTWARRCAVVVILGAVCVVPPAAAVITAFALVDSPRDRNHVPVALEFLLVEAVVVQRELTTDRRAAIAVVVSDKQSGVALTFFV
jgi:hypothetical protein